MTWLVPATAAAVGTLFAAAVARRARATEAPSDVLWTAGLVAYALASVLEARAEAAGWSVVRYRLYFALSPALVGLLGAGTAHLAARRAGRPAAARWFTGLLLGLLGVAAFGQFLVPLEPFTVVGTAERALPLRIWDASLGAKAIPFPHPARVAFLLVNVLGGLALVGGAAWTGWEDEDRAVLAIGLGALLPFAGGVLSSAGWPAARIPLQLVGVVVMFVGYQVSVGGFPEPSPSADGS